MEVRGLTLKGEITMMKAIKNFMNKPITWGASFKWTGIVLGLYRTTDKSKLAEVWGVDRASAVFLRVHGCYFSIYTS